MSVYKDLCAGETTTVDDAGVIETIAQNHVSFSDQNRNDPRVCLEAGIEYQRGFCAFQLRDLALQLFVQGHVPGNQPRRAGTTAVAIDRLLGRFSQRRMVGKTEIVIGRKIENLTAVDCQNRILLPRNRSETAIKRVISESL